MYCAALEFGKFVQVERTETEKRAKLIEIALKWLSRRDCVFPRDTAPDVVVEDIVRSYRAGEDILDPALFWREDIEDFAKENGVTGDPMVREFISRAKPA